MNDGFDIALTVEYEGQAENVIAKFKMEHNAFMLGQYIVASVQKNPIIRIVNLETHEVLGAFQRELKELEKTTSVFEK